MGLALVIVMLISVAATTLFILSDPIKYVEAQTNIETSNQSAGYNFELWATNSEVSKAWNSGTQGRICPDPEVDAPTKFKIDPYSGADIPDPDPSVTISIYMTMPNGSKSYLSEGLTYEHDQDLCKSDGLIGSGFYPLNVGGQIGKYAFYGIARWMHNGTVHEIRSNDVEITVKPPIYQMDPPVEVELMPDLPVGRLLDWSPDGDSILVSSGEGSLDLISPADGKKIRSLELPTSFTMIIDAQFSPDSDDLVLVWGEESLGDDLGLYALDLSKNTTSTIATNSEETTINSAAWFPDEGAPKVVYGTDLYSAPTSDAYQGYRIWLADIDGTRVKKLFEKTFDQPNEQTGSGIPIDERQHFAVYDVAKDGQKLLMSVSKPSNGPFAQGNLTIYDIDKQQFRSLMPVHRVSDPQFSPSDDLIIYDVGVGHRTPGGPLVIMDVDAAWSEYFRLGEEKPYDDPVSFVVSPDGHHIVAQIQEWSEGSTKMVKSQLAHPVPEFSTIALFAAMASTIGATIAAGRSRLK